MIRQTKALPNSYDVTHSGLFAALHVQGVQKVVLTSPVTDVVVLDHQVGHCAAVDLQLAKGSYV